MADKSKENLEISTANKLQQSYRAPQISILNIPIITQGGNESLSSEANQGMLAS